MRLAIDDVFRKHCYESEGFQAVGFALMKAGDKQSAQLYERMLPLFSRNVFREGSGLVQKNKINIIHLSRMDLATQHVVTEMLLSYFWRLGNADQFKGEGKISIFLDECQNLDASKNAPLSQLISEGRKMGISLLLATQMIIAGSNSAVQQRILQSGLQLYFKPANNQVMQTAKLLNTGNENMWANVLGNLKTGQFVALGNLSIGNRSIDYPIVVDARIEENNTAAGAANKGSLRGTVRMR
jgi:DNA phosphorothioation-dependent restriction protein DptH